MAKKDDVPTVPARTELKKVTLERNSRALELQGRDPRFVYQAFSTEPDHPSYIGKRLRRHEIGDQFSGFATVEPWEICQDALNEKVAALDPRTDQGQKIDSTLRYGRQIVCRLPVEEFAKYEAVDTARSKRMSEQIYASPDTIRQRGASMTTVVSREDVADPATLLRQAGHPGV